MVFLLGLNLVFLNLVNLNLIEFNSTLNFVNLMVNFFIANLANFSFLDLNFIDLAGICLLVSFNLFINFNLFS